MFRIVLAALCSSILFLAASPAQAVLTAAAATDGCPAGTVRKATVTDIQKLQQNTGQVLPVGTCLTPELTQQVGLDTGAVDAVKALDQFICPRYQKGLPAGAGSSIPWSSVKEQYVYFQGQGSSVDPQFAKCVLDFLQQARTRSPGVCISAGLRTADHQRASCLDTSNGVVCGRASNCSNFQGCPHVNGRGMDIGIWNAAAGRVDVPTPELIQLARSKNLKYGFIANDAWHMEPNGGCVTGGFSNPYTSTGASQPGTYSSTLLPTQGSGISPAVGVLSFATGLLQGMGFGLRPQQAQAPSTVYVQQPVVTSMPPQQTAQAPDLSQIQPSVTSAPIQNPGVPNSVTTASPKPLGPAPVSNTLINTMGLNQNVLLSYVPKKPKDFDEPDVIAVPVATQTKPLSVRGKTGTLITDNESGFSVTTINDDNTAQGGFVGEKNIKGFAVDNERASQSTFASLPPIARMCATRPWARPPLSTVFTPGIFDAMCLRLGYAPVEGVE